MLEQFLRQAFGVSPTRLDHPIVNQLRATWRQNPGAAILWARWNWRELPAGLAAQASQLQAMATQQQRWMREQRAINDSVNAQMGALGFDPRPADYGGFGGFGTPHQDPDELLMIAALGEIQRNSGDPPAPPALTDVAESVLRGQRDPLDALRFGAPPAAHQQVEFIIQACGSFGSFLKLQGLLTAAFAVPRSRIPALLGFEKELAEWNLANQYASSIGSAKELMARSDWAAAEAKVLEALSAAERTPGKDDDIEAVQYAVYLALQSKVSSEFLRSALRVDCALVREGHRLDDAALLLASLSLLVESYGLSSELEPGLLEPIRLALAGVTDPTTRLKLSLRGASISLRQGDSSVAAEFLDDAESSPTTPDEHLELAMARADVAWANLDRDGAAIVMANAIESQAGASDGSKNVAIQKLVSLWPEGVPGIDRWVKELESRIDSLGEPERTLNRISVLLALVRAGQREAIARIANGVDFAQLRRNMPSSMHHMLDELEESAREAAQHGHDGAGSPPCN